MQNAESNVGQAQQNEMAARSPAHTPATGSASPDAETLAREFGSTKTAGSAEPTPGPKTSDPLPPVDLDSQTSDSEDPLERARSRIVSVDVANTGSSDNTVDTDGKGLEAKRDLPAWHDNVISSNATLENNVPTPAAGLGGIDSRAGGSLPLIAARSGWRVVHCGTVHTEERNGSRVEHVIEFHRSS
ncbi:DUF3005 domain-containing protein [Paraburkholderia strydomiana]|uniref:DUF3005 domain-containing protein n=1 Tax=Paraburkholderia strydomiana TaxID=1245417 RepID=UPI001BE51BA4|nr:DUF3005 domain-containing protein [Paraburkholderia strydomiana]MBT2794683.1 DUF3005 domain-containing protein [Paraburkholderia strydomiana]